MAHHNSSHLHCRKLRYRDAREAKDALFRIRVVRGRQEHDGLPSRRNECRWYQCPRCKGYHLTSERPLDLELAA